jgi:hypothetical protein
MRSVATGMSANRATAALRKVGLATAGPRAGGCFLLRIEFDMSRLCIVNYDKDSRIISRNLRTWIKVELKKQLLSECPNRSPQGGNAKIFVPPEQAGGCQEGAAPWRRRADDDGALCRVAGAEHRK